MTAWTDHVKAYSIKKGISYKEGLKDPGCKKSYHDAKTEKKEVDKGNKHFKESSDLLVVGTPSITVPEKMLLIKENGDEAIINPVTKSGTLARKNKQNILKINQSDTNFISVDSNGTSRSRKIKNIELGRNKKASEKSDHLREISAYKRIHENDIKKIEEKPNKTKRELTKLAKLKEEYDVYMKDYNKRYDKASMYAPMLKKYNH
jgi:virulence-associated protein VagC